MDAKLTVKLDREIGKNAKVYAKERNTSLTKLIESYLALLTTPANTTEVTPLVKSLSGVVPLSQDSDYKKKYKKHILSKYSV
jgi:hypothetical protein